jgi:hypothetical protein
MRFGMGLIKNEHGVSHVRRKVPKALEVVTAKVMGVPSSAFRGSSKRWPPRTFAFGNSRRPLPLCDSRNQALSTATLGLDNGVQRSLRPLPMTPDMSAASASTTSATSCVGLNCGSGWSVAERE